MSDLALSTLLRAIAGLPEGAVVWADTWRDAADAADLNTAERGAAPRVAARLGYLEPLVLQHRGQRFLACTTSDRERGKGGRVVVYTRTAKPVPEHLCRGAA